MRRNTRLFALISAISLIGFGCGPSHFIGQSAQLRLIGQPDLRGAQMGISLYDPVEGKYLYDHGGDGSFTPASNTKLFTLYAGMKWLGDSLPGVGILETDTALFIQPCGDPTLLHPGFASQPVIDYLKKTRKPVYFVERGWEEEPLGRGWAWDDYNDYYSAERSPLPVYGNTVRWVQQRQGDKIQDSTFDSSPSFYSIPEVDWTVRFNTDTGRHSFFARRSWNENIFQLTEGPEKYKEQEVPFITGGLESALLLLRDTVGRAVFSRPDWPKSVASSRGRSAAVQVRSGPVDSLFRPMMYNSDNFFAEQTLLMVSYKRLGVANDQKITDTLLRNELGRLPQRPSWVDGSGLSRYNLFSPRDFIWLLDKMQQEFGMERMKRLLPTGGAGTLRSLYKNDSGYIFAKTGSLSGVVALSGYLFTRKNRLLIFSVLINNHQGSSAAIRKDIQQFLSSVREKY